MSENIKLEAIVNVLRKKIGSGNALQDIFTRGRVQAAQKVIENTKEDYFDSIQGITAVFQAAVIGDIKPQQIYEATKSLKAQAEGLGFTFLMEVSDSLYKYLQGKVDIYSENPKIKFNKDEKLVVQKHSEAIAATLGKRERGKGGMVEAGILNSLELLKRKHTKPGA